jgi:hypothetical protein
MRKKLTQKMRQKETMQKPKKDAIESRLQVARRDPGEASAPGLFRCFDRKARIAYEVNGEKTYEMHALTKEDKENGIIRPYRLRLRDGKSIPILVNSSYNVEWDHAGAVLFFAVAEGLEWLDLKIYKGLLAMAYTAGIMVDSNSQGKNQKEIHEGFEYSGSGLHESVIAVGGYRELARAIGYTGSIGGATISNIKSSISRLGRVRVTVTTKDEKTSFNMIAYSSLKEERLTIGLNLRVVAILQNGNAAGFTHIDLNELRQIDCAVTGLIHAKLESHLSPGASHKYSLRTLYRHVWLTELDMAEGKNRMRLPVIRKAVENLRALGWSATEYQEDFWEITRTKLALKSDLKSTFVNVPPSEEKEF